MSMREKCLWNNNTRKPEPKTICLQNSYVVIDGQNYFHGIYEGSKLPFVFGAEANEYAKILKKNMQKFKDANVNCYIVFKGSDKNIDKKIGKLWQTTFDFNTHYNFAAPVLMKEIYKQVLDELGYTYATSVMESKNDCIALSKALECPVLSQDKEFFFKSANYIPYQTLKPSNGNILCQHYSVKDYFEKNYRLTDRNKIAICLAIIDGTVFPINSFNGLLRAFHIKENTIETKLHKIFEFISVQSELHILNTISNVFETKTDKNIFMSQVNVLRETMYNDNHVVVNYLLGKPIEKSLWFEKGVASQKIATEYVYLYKYKMIMGSWAIERNDGVDSIMCSIDIIKYAYNLLTNFEPATITVYQSAKKFETVNSTWEISRPKYHCKESVFENGWSEISQFKLFEHFLAINNISSGALHNLPHDSRMLVLSLVYFSRKKESENKNVTKEVYCFIMSYVLLNFVMEGESDVNAHLGILGKDCDAAKIVTKDYFHYDTEEAKIIFNADTLKALVELQYCLLHMNYLNILCGSPYTKTKYHRTFNGTFIYKLLKDIEVCDEDYFITTLLRTAPSILNFVKLMINTYKTTLNN